MSEAKRLQKRWKRENRKDKGVSTAAKIAAHNARIRDARSLMGGWGTTDESMLLLAASMLGKRR